MSIYKTGQLTVTDVRVTGASKKMRPESAIGSLFNAPTILQAIS